METALLLSLIYAGVFTLVCIVISLILVYVIYLMKSTRATTY